MLKEDSESGQHRTRSARRAHLAARPEHKREAGTHLRTMAPASQRLSERDNLGYPGQM